MDEHSLSKSLNHYRQSLSLLESLSENGVDKQSYEQSIIEVFLLRDVIEKMLASSVDLHHNNKGEVLLQLTRLDQRLQALSHTLAQQLDLATLRKTLNCSEQHWWWYFEVPPVLKPRFDWVWNALTAGALALAASFMYNIYSAFVSR